MNILFYTVFEVSPTKGGTERITDTIVNGLKSQSDFECYSIYSIPISSDFNRTEFVESQQIPFGKDFENSLYEFVKKNNIDIIVNQGAFSLTPLMRYVLEKFSQKYLITVHHFNPGAEENFFNLHEIIYQFRTNKSVKSKIRNCFDLIFYPCLKYLTRKKLSKAYYTAYCNSDKIVLLSEKFKKEWMEYARISASNKFYYIHNALSFDTFFDISEYGGKKHEVLIVSRLNETQKRLSLSLKIWKIIENVPDFDDWHLTIVGHGNEYEHYKSIIRQNKLRRVVLEGLQQPEPYYRRASIFMLTSAYEGWGLTLTEAQQFGVIPLAFNSYASLTDIITDGENGFVIPDGNLELYAKKMMVLMKNDELRKKMAENAIQSSKRFEKKKICSEWISLFELLK